MRRSQIALRLVSLAVFFLAMAIARGQSIQGIVNVYTSVLQFEECNGVTVTNSLGFVTGDTVLIIQMKGGVINTSDNSAFGTILDYKDAGNYEFGIVSHVTGNTILLRDSLLHHFDPSGLVQLIRVPRYENANVIGTLTAAPWNGSTGGVLAIIVAGDLRLQADVDVSGLGFRGGALGSSQILSSFPDYAAPLASGNGGGKGEGFVVANPLLGACRGPYGNGGGGGNRHNSGGAGGANYGEGGDGGNQYSGASGNPAVGGFGGLSLQNAPTSDRLFVGGGGGGGHQNTGGGTPGMAGGGIVIIRAATLNGGGHLINASGLSARASGYDGAGGGGAGGTVLLDIPAITSAVTVNVQGGNGGSTDNGGLVRACHGTGGGGGGGMFEYSGASLPPTVTLLASGGLAGLETNPTSDCYNTTYGAKPGKGGALSVKASISWATKPFAMALVTTSNDTTICAGDSVHLSATASAPVRWEAEPSLSCTDCPSPWAHPAITTVYHVSVPGVGDCFADDSIKVTVLPIPTVTVGHDTTICPGGSALLTAEGGTRYSWTPTDGVDCPTCGGTPVHPTKTTRYVVSVENQLGCARLDSILVTVAQPGALDLGTDKSLCLGDSVQLTAPGVVSCHWEPAEGLSCTDCLSPKASPSATTTYQATARTAGDCETSGSVTVNVLMPPMLQVPTRRVKICAGDTASIAATGTGILQWSPSASLTCTSCSSTQAFPGNTTTYYASLTNGTGCAAVDSVIVEVVPRSSLATMADTLICGGDSLQLWSASDGPVVWSPASELSCTDCANPVAHPTTNATYVVTAINANDCGVVDSIHVVVDPLVRATARIERTNRVFPGNSIAIPILLDGPVLPSNGVGTVHLALEYNSRLLRFEGYDQAGTLLEGWSLVDNSKSGKLATYFTYDGSRLLQGAGPLVYLRFTSFLADTNISELPLSIDLPEAQCMTLTVQPGQIQLDSICGLSFRMIQMSASKYALGTLTPNPFSRTVEIPFSLGLEGHATMEIFDVLGKRVALLVDGDYAAGTYSVVWNATSFNSGLYYCRVSSNTWSATQPLRLEK